MKNNNEKAFTLAEVLIVIGIIGVVAAILVPILINQIKDYQNKIMLKVAFEQLSDVSKKIANDRGGTLLGIAETGNQCDRERFALEFSKYIPHSAKEGHGCGILPTTNNFDLFPDNIYLYEQPSVLADFGSGHASASWKGFLALKGYSAGFFNYWGDINCVGNSLSSKDVCAMIFVDTNWSKPPNMIGKDLFQFFLKSNGILVPAGVPTNTVNPGSQQAWNDFKQTAIRLIE